MITVYGERGDIEGFFNTTLETTRAKLSDRRTRWAIQLNICQTFATLNPGSFISMPSPSNMASFWDEVLQSFEIHDRDIPFALVYSLDKTKRYLDPSTTGLPPGFRLEADLGLKSKARANTTGLQEISRRFLTLLVHAQSCSGINNVFVCSAIDGTLPNRIFNDLHWRGFQEEPTSVAVISSP